MRNTDGSIEVLQVSGAMMEFDLAPLQKLNEIDRAITECHKKEDGLPAKIQAIEDEVAARQAEMDGEKSKLSETLASKKAAETEVEGLKGKIAHYRDQLLSVKTNKEYSALLKEIELAQKKIDSIEERIIGLMIEMDEHNAHVKKIESWFQSEKAKLLAQKAGLEGEHRQTVVRREGLEASRAGIEEQLPEIVRRTYSRVRELRGDALAEARDEFCMECHVRLRPQVYNDLKSNAQLITCDSCYRILYYSGPPPAPAEEEVTTSAAGGDEENSADG